MSREDKLKQLEGRNKTKIALITDDEFGEVLQDKISTLKDVLGQGIELNNVEDLLEVLTTIQQIHKEVADLRIVAAAIKDIKFPESVSVSGIAEITEVLKRLPTETKIVNKINNTNVMDEYQASNSDTQDELNKYYGFVHATGKWYVLKIMGSENSKAYKYAAGIDAYASNWAIHKNLKYQRFDQVSL